MTGDTEAREWVRAAVAGNIRAVIDLPAPEHRTLVAAGFQPRELTVTRGAVLRALRDYESGQIADAELQHWAWFVSRGYVPGQSIEPVMPLQIEYELEFEDAILEVLERLRELGDAIDGKIEPAEMTALAQRLTS